jgi:hypothetical protein
MRLLLDAFTKNPHILGKGIPALLKECQKNLSIIKDVCSNVYLTIKAAIYGAGP